MTPEKKDPVPSANGNRANQRSLEWTNNMRIQSGFQRRRTYVYFDTIRRAAQPCLEEIIRELLPNGDEYEGKYFAGEAQIHLAVDLSKGSWEEVTGTGASGDDIISLLADLEDVSPTEAAIIIGQKMGVEHV